LVELVQELTERFTFELASDSLSDEGGEAAASGPPAGSDGELVGNADGKLFSSLGHARILLK
jgi:hypothetical protein